MMHTNFLKKAQNTCDVLHTIQMYIRSMYMCMKNKIHLHTVCIFMLGGLDIRCISSVMCTLLQHMHFTAPTHVCIVDNVVNTVQ
jgi:hypothetical protein